MMCTYILFELYHVSFIKICEYFFFTISYVTRNNYQKTIKKPKELKVYNNYQHGLYKINNSLWVYRNIKRCNFFLKPFLFLEYKSPTLLIPYKSVHYFGTANIFSLSHSRYEET